MKCELILPAAAYERSYRAYIEELGDEERYPFPLDFDHADFQSMLRRLDDFAQGVNLPEGFVPSGELVGVSNLRHMWNDRIREIGGHIGLSIAEARRRGIDPIHIHYHKDNLASARMILRNGGVLESEVPEPGSTHVVQRFLRMAPA